MLKNMLRIKAEDSNPPPLNDFCFLLESFGLLPRRWLTMARIAGSLPASLGLRVFRLLGLVGYSPP